MPVRALITRSRPRGVGFGEWGGLPKPDLIMAGGNQRVAIGQKGNMGRTFQMPTEGGDLLPRGHIPNCNETVHSTNSHSAEVGGECDASIERRSGVEPEPF